jgi:hypothetical protein
METKQQNVHEKMKSFRLLPNSLRLWGDYGYLPIPRGETTSSSRRSFTVKKVNDFPIPSRDVTYQTLPERE